MHNSVKKETKNCSMPDRDLASLYGVETRVMNQAVRRTSSALRVFSLTKDEAV